MMISKTFFIINQYASTPERGIGGRHYYLARELVNLGHKVYLIAASNTHLLRNPHNLRNDYKLENISGLKFVWIKTSKYKYAKDKKRIWNWFLFALKLLKLSKIVPDKPHTILYSSPSLISFLSAFYLAKKFNSKLVWDIRDIWPLTLIKLGKFSKFHPFIIFFQWIENFASKKSDFITSNIPLAINHLLKKGVKKKNFLWIPNGFSEDDFKKKKILNLSTANKIPSEKFIIGYSGTIGMANALNILLDAAFLTKNYNDIHYVLVGDGSSTKEIREFILVNKLQNVSLLKSIPKKEIPSLLEHFDVCYAGLSKSSIYKYGIALNKLPEYFMSGKPIVLSLDSVYKPVELAKAGLTVPAENPQAIVNAIFKFKKMTLKKRIQVGKNGKNYAKKNHDYFKIAKNLEKVLM